MLLFDNARLTSARITQEKKILDLGWSVLRHPLYQPQLEPNNFHLLRSQQNILNDKKCSQKDQFVENFLSSKPSKHNAK